MLLFFAGQGGSRLVPFSPPCREPQGHLMQQLHLDFGCIASTLSTTLLWLACLRAACTLQGTMGSSH